MAPNIRSYLSIEDVARLLGLEASEVKAMVQRGELPTARRAGCIVVPTRAWRRWVAGISERALTVVAGTRR